MGISLEQNTETWQICLKKNLNGVQVCGLVKLW